MARIKFGKRLKNPFIKRKSSERSNNNNNESGDDRSTSSYVSNRSVFSEGSDVSNQSSGTGGYSLDSNARDLGPIDIDSCRKHGENNNKKKGGSSLSSVGSRKSRNSSSVKQRELPKIVESRSYTSLNHPNGEGSYSRDSTPIQMDAPEPPPPPAVEYEAFLPQPLAVAYGAFLPEHTSPGAQSVPTTNGSDVFERNRLSMSRTRSDRSIMTRTRSDRTIVSRTLSPPPIVDEVDYNTVAAAEQQSPGAQTVSTINGRDIFERNRSSMSTSTPIPVPDRFSVVTPKSSNQRKESSSFVTSLGSSRSASPGVLSRIHKRERSENTLSTNGLFEEAEELINCDPLERNRTDRSDYYSTKNTITGNEREATTPVKEKQEKQMPKPSPTSIIQYMFDSEYPVELDPVESHVEENDADFPQCQDKATELHQQHTLSSQEEPPPPRQPPTPSATVMAVAGSKSKNKRSESQTPQSEPESLWIAPPQIHRRSPSKMFNDACNSIKSSVPWDPLTYTSLEDAVAAHAAMLTEGGSGSVNSSDKKMDGASAANSIAAMAPLPRVPADCGSVITSSSRMSSSRSKEGTEPSNRPASKEFLALKKVAEKNEFKKKAFLKKTANGAVVSPEDATRMTSIEPQENIELQAMVDGIGNREDDKVVPADPPGFVATRTRSTTPTIEDSPPRSSSNSLLLQDDVVAPAPQAQSASEIVVDVIQSFSYDQDCGMEYSLSDDSCSYLSDLETIGDITICDETTRLLEAHKLYDKDAKMNPNHPSRRKKSNMKVGSRFRRLKSSFSRGSEPNSGLMNPTYPSDDTIDGCSVKTEIVKQPSNKLTWYDDEVNWDKPFTLRTDESFDASTVTSLDTKGVGGMKRIRIVRYNDVNQLLGDFIKGINKYTACGGGDDVASYDASGQDEI